MPEPAAWTVGLDEDAAAAHAVEHDGAVRPRWAERRQVSRSGSP
jgi:hypothetical protein